jgi:hypothetical protein
LYSTWYAGFSKTAGSLKCSLSKLLCSFTCTSCCLKSPFFLCLKSIQETKLFMVIHFIFSLKIMHINCHMSIKYQTGIYTREERKNPTALIT